MISMNFSKSFDNEVFNSNESFEYMPTRQPIIHRGVDAPACDSCTGKELVFFDPNCEGCLQRLRDPTTTIAELFAVLRQWTPQTQQNLHIIIEQILKRGAHIDDRDGLTDMTMLHYASKAGARGVGNSSSAARTVSMLLSKGAYPDIRCRWTHMSPLHYAVYFDVAPVITTLLTATKSLDIDSTCAEFDHGTPLHIAASNLSLEAVKVLIELGADPTIVDNLGRRPADCIPDEQLFLDDQEITQVIKDMKNILNKSLNHKKSQYGSTDHESITLSKVTLQALDLKIGDTVVVGTSKTGKLCFCGSTKFASGIWAGIEFEEPLGKNDGSVNGIYYFHCQQNHGIFAPITKVTKPGMIVQRSASQGTNRRAIQHAPSFDVSRVSAKIDTGLNRSPSSFEKPENIEIGDCVMVVGKRKGVVRFIGNTQFAPGLWYGIELDKREGRNDGSVDNIRYFTCKPMHGVFSPLSRIKKFIYISKKLASADDENSLDSVNTDIMSLSEYTAHSSTTKTSLKNIMTSSLTNSTAVRLKSAPSAGITRTPGSSSNLQLCIGTTVFCSSGMGVVRYIGPTHIAEGLWIGLELRSPRGKHDGNVDGHRYFTCKSGHGIYVRPNKVSVRGINGTTLLANYVPPLSPPLPK